jgi:hypothetical protein
VTGNYQTHYRKNPVSFAICRAPRSTVKKYFAEYAAEKTHTQNFDPYQKHDLG